MRWNWQVPKTKSLKQSNERAPIFFFTWKFPLEMVVPDFLGTKNSFEEHSYTLGKGTERTILASVRRSLHSQITSFWTHAKETVQRVLRSLLLWPQNGN